MDERSGVTQQVPGCDVLIAGTSCKTFSALNASQKSSEDMSSSSGSTLHALLMFVDRRKPLLVIAENVMNMLAQRRAENYERASDKFLASMRSRGYTGSFAKVNALQFGLPQSRHRVYFIFFRAGCGDPFLAADRVRSFEQRWSGSLSQFFDCLEEPTAGSGRRKRPRCEEHPLQLEAKWPLVLEQHIESCCIDRCRFSCLLEQARTEFPDFTRAACSTLAAIGH